MVLQEDLPDRLIWESPKCEAISVVDKGCTCKAYQFGFGERKR